MTTITRERLEQALANPTKINFNYGETLELARIVLASLDAEPVMYAMTNGSFDEEAVSTDKAVVDAWVDEWNPDGTGEPLYKAVPLYTVKPAPVSPVEMPLVEIECDICGFKSTALDGAHYCCEDNSDD